jgi:hypothetical protein
VDLATRQAAKATVRDTSMQKLRDLTIVVGVAAMGAVAILAWISSVTIPGVAAAGQSAGDGSQLLAPSNQGGDDDGYNPPSTSVAPAPRGSGFVVSGGSH